MNEQQHIRILEELRHFYCRTMGVYERFGELLVQLPADEQQMLRLLGDYSLILTELPHYIFERSPIAVHVIEKAARVMLGRWPQIPRVDEYREQISREETLYDYPDPAAFVKWSYPEVHDELIRSFENKGCNFECEMLIDCTLHVKLLINSIPWFWYKKSWTPRPKPAGMVATLRWSIANLRWVIINIDREDNPMQLLMGDSGQAQLIGDIVRNLHEAGIHGFTFRKTDESVAIDPCCNEKKT